MLVVELKVRLKVQVKSWRRVGLVLSPGFCSAKRLRHIDCPLHGWDIIPSQVNSQHTCKQIPNFSRRDWASVDEVPYMGAQHTTSSDHSWVWTSNLRDPGPSPMTTEPIATKREISILFWLKKARLVSLIQSYSNKDPNAMYYNTSLQQQFWLRYL